jgi:hypothetical protein
MTPRERRRLQNAGRVRTLTTVAGSPATVAVAYWS